MLAHGVLAVQQHCAYCVTVQVHNLSGPIRVTDDEGKPALPGDILVVEICDLGALEGDEWGFTGIFDRENGAFRWSQCVATQPVALEACSCLCSGVHKCTSAFRRICTAGPSARCMRCHDGDSWQAA